MRLAIAGLKVRARQHARSVAGWAYGAWWWTFLVVTSTILWPLVVLVPGRARRWAMVRLAARLFLRLVAVRVEVTGAWPATVAGIVAINHSSYFDNLVLAAILPGQPAFVAKRELDGQLVAGPFLRALGALFVERDDPEGGIKDAREALEAARSGRTLVFFPEGTFTRVYGLRPFRLGAFAIAVEQQIAVLPVTLCGTRSILRDGQWLPRHGNASVHVGNPLAPDGHDFAAAIRLRDRVRAAILAHTTEPDLVVS